MQAPPAMQALLFERPGTALGDLLQLADEMTEDPRCRMVALGTDELGSVLFSLWDSEVAAEVHQGLAERGDGTVRRLSIPDGLVAWG